MINKVVKPILVAFNSKRPKDCREVFRKHLLHMKKLCLTSKCNVFDLALSYSTLMVTSHSTEGNPLIAGSAITSEIFICEVTIVCVICF